MKNNFSTLPLRSEASNSRLSTQKGFTLIEILIVFALISILSIIMFVNFSVIPKARDAKRKADLREITNAFEQYRKDKGQYPSVSGGNVPVNCPMGTPTYFGNAPDCDTIYLKKIPKDPNGSTWWRSGNYLYGPSSNGYMIFACIENTNDPEKWYWGVNPFTFCSTHALYLFENP